MMNQLYILLFAALLCAASDCAAQFKPLRYQLQKGQKITTEVWLESGLTRHGREIITVDSIDARGGAFLTIAPAEPPTEYEMHLDATGGVPAYMGGATIKAVLTPRGEVRINSVVDLPDIEWRRRIKADTVYRSIWGADAGMMVYQFLFPYMPRNDGIAVALDTVQTASYARRGAPDNGSDDESALNAPPIDNAAYFTVKTVYHRGTPFEYNGEMLYTMTRSEEETEENCLNPAKPMTYISTRQTQWTVRQSDGAMLQETMISYRVAANGTWQGIIRTFDALNGKQ